MNRPVETSTLRALRAHLAQRRGPVFLSGAPGAGKTTLLKALAEDGQARGVPVAYVSLAGDATSSGLVNLLVRQLAPDGEDSVVTSSSSRAEEAGLDALARLADGLVLLDDIHLLMDDNRGVLRAMRRLMQMRLQVVIAGDGSRMDGSAAREVLSPAHMLTTQPLTPEEVQQMLPSGLAPAESGRIGQLARDNPRLAALLVGVVSRFGVVALDALGVPAVGMAGHPELAGFLKQMLRDEWREDGPTPSEMNTWLVRLVVRGGAGLPRAKVDAKAARWLEQSVFVRTEGDTFYLAEASLSGDLLLATALVSPVAATDLSFGAEEAERDGLLAGVFRKPAGLDDLRNGQRSIVIGDRGAGKSALFKALTSTEAPLAGPVEFIRLDERAELALRLESSGKGLTTAEQFRAAWLLAIACTLAAHVTTASATREKLAKRLRDTIPLLSAAGDSPASGNWFKRTWRRLRRDAQGVNVKFTLGPVTLESPKAAAQAVGPAIDVSEFLRETASALKAEGRCVAVAVDRIDEVHKYERAIQEPLVQGLFLAEAAPEHRAQLPIVIFIRTDLFETYDIQEKNKLVTRQLPLSWKEDALLQMAMERVFSNPALSALRAVAWAEKDLADALPAVFPREVEGRPFEDWLWHSLRNGNGRVSPRQLILLLVLARDAAVEIGQPIGPIPLLSEAVIGMAMTRLSELSFTEATTDFRVAPTFLRNLRAARTEEFAIDKVENLFSKSEGEPSSQIEMLERLGIVERLVVKDAQGVMSSRLRVPPLYTRCWQAPGI